MSELIYTCPCGNCHETILTRIEYTGNPSCTVWPYVCYAPCEKTPHCFSTVGYGNTAYEALLQAAKRQEELGRRAIMLEEGKPTIPSYYVMGGGDVFDFIYTKLIPNKPPWCTSEQYTNLIMLYSHAFKYVRRCLHKGTTWEAITSDIDKAQTCLERLKQEVYHIFEHHAEESTK